MTDPSGERSTLWRYSVCGLLLLATMLNYMDRQTLSQLATTIRAEYHLTHSQYGGLETGFGFAFATGALFFGFLADRVSVRWLYPSVLLGWSLAGIATAYADEIGVALSSWQPASQPQLDPDNGLPIPVLGSTPGGVYFGFLACRIVLGFFEAGHWPCALITTQVILTQKDRSFGNSILQSGAAIGAILTPIIVVTLLPLTDAADHYPPGTWRMPFAAIGVIGMAWALPWLALVRGGDLDRRRMPLQSHGETPGELQPMGEPLPLEPTTVPAEELQHAITTTKGRRLPLSAATPSRDRSSLLFMFAALVVAVISINLSWQFLRAWLPMFLEESHGYTKKQVQWLTAAYYVAADVGCISVGLIVKWLASRGWVVHNARMFMFAVCAGLTLLSVAFVFLPAGPLLVVVLLVVAAGALGLFPNYYSFAQEPSRTHQGKITGSLGTIAWMTSSPMQWLVGANIEATRSYATGIVMAGMTPLLALLAMLTLWPRTRDEPPEEPV